MKSRSWSVLRYGTLDSCGKQWGLAEPIVRALEALTSRDRARPVLILPSSLHFLMLQLLPSGVLLPRTSLPREFLTEG